MSNFFLLTVAVTPTVAVKASELATDVDVDLALLLPTVQVVGVPPLGVGQVIVVVCLDPMVSAPALTSPSCGFP